jgi:hypothetical protein
MGLTLSVEHTVWHILFCCHAAIEVVLGLLNHIGAGSWQELNQLENAIHSQFN